MQENTPQEGTAQQEDSAQKDTIPQMHDRAFKVLFGFMEIVRQFLLECGPYAGIPARTFDHVDIDAMEPVDPVIIDGITYAERLGDRMWRIEYVVTENGVKRRRCLYLYVPFEFQSTIDRDMAFRFGQFVQMARADARSRGEYLKNDEPPLMLPFVVYCGGTPWEDGLGKREPSDLIAIEKALKGEVFALLDMQSYALEEAGRHDLIAHWARLERASEGSSMASTMMLIYSWIERSVPEDERKRKLRQAFYWRATELGVLWTEDGKSELSFDELEELYHGGTMQEVVESNYQKRMRQMCDEVREEGLVHQRNMLHRIAMSRFDADTARQLAVLLERIDDPNRLEDITDWTVNGYTKAEFLRRVEGLIG